jgi:Na+/H+ antiporter NhaD/arsenite permease-like protein
MNKNKNKSLKRNPLFVFLIIVLMVFLGIFLINKFSSAPVKSFNIYKNSTSANDEEKVVVKGLSKEDILYKIDWRAGAR